MPYSYKNRMKTFKIRKDYSLFFLEERTKTASEIREIPVKNPRLGKRMSFFLI